MSSAADLLLADTSEASAIVASDYPLGTFKGVNVDGLDPLKTAALHSLLAQKGFADVLREYQPIAQASPGGPWLVRLPSELIMCLTHVSPQDQASLAARWASSDQAQEAGWTEEDADGYLGRLIPFAHTAAFDGKDLYLWIYS
jgi:hypothetical protein